LRQAAREFISGDASLGVMPACIQRQSISV
jgi:hypothetical protein